MNTTYTKLNKQLKTNLIQPYIITNDKKLDNFITPTVKTFTKYNIKDKIKGKTVLDIGCNTGLFCFFAKEAGASYIRGIDCNLSFIELAKKADEILNYNIDFQHLKVPKLTELPINKQTESYNLLTEKKFDIVFCMSVYHYLYAQYRNHETIFQILSLITDEIYWENPVDMTDSSCNKLFTAIMPEEKTNYTEEKILKVASNYFTYEYLGLHPGKTRKAYYFKKKEKIKDYKILKTVYHNPTTNTIVQKVKKDNKIYALKCQILSSPVHTQYYNTIYKTLYPKIQTLSEIVNIYDTWNDNNKYYILMEWLGDYIPFNETNIKKQATYLSKETIKKLILSKLLKILSNIFKTNILVIDMSPGNIFFKVEKTKVFVKLIDIDPLTTFTNDYYEMCELDKDLLTKYAVSYSYFLTTLHKLLT